MRAAAGIDRGRSAGDQGSGDPVRHIPEQRTHGSGGGGSGGGGGSHSGGRGQAGVHTFHAFGIMGKTVTHSHVTSQSPAPRSPQSSGGGGLKPGNPLSADLQRALAELEPVYRQGIPGLIPTSMSPDGIIMCEATSNPGVTYVQRTRSAKNANPDRLNLDRRNLTSCCQMLGEDRLRLLNYQHNHIHVISNLSGTPNLVFLDLYANSIQDLSPLSAAPSLRVLMLGRNSIKEVTGLGALSKLDVLDLHNNLIESMQGLENAGALRILNLAGNHIRRLGDMRGLSKLVELNLRRNHLSTLCKTELLHPEDSAQNGYGSEDSFEDTGRDRHHHWPPQLQRLFLSHNRLMSIEELRPLRDMLELQEVSLDGNPVASSGHPQDYRRKVLGLCPPGVTTLDLTEVSEDEQMLFRGSRSSSSHGGAGVATGLPPGAPMYQSERSPVLRDYHLVNQQTDPDSFGYGITGTAAKLRPQTAMTRQQQQEEVRQTHVRPSTAALGHRNGVIRRKTQEGVASPAPPYSNGQYAYRQPSRGGATDTDMNALLSSIADQRTFSGVPSEVAAEMSDLWKDSYDFEEELLEPINSATNLIMSRRNHNQHRSSQDSGEFVHGAGPAAAHQWVGQQAPCRPPQSPGGVSRAYRPHPPTETPDAEGYAELIDDGRRVEIYGKAIETLKQPSALVASEVFIMYLPVEDLEETVAVLAVMVNLRKLTIDENNIHFLHQLDALAALTDVTDVVVGAGNPVIELVLFRPYLISRMPHLQTLNEAPVTNHERQEALQLFLGYDQLLEEHQNNPINMLMRSLDLEDSYGSDDEQLLPSSRSAASSIYAPPSAQPSFGGRSSTSTAGTGPAAGTAGTPRVDNLLHADRLSQRLLKDCVEARENLDAFDRLWPKMLQDMAICGSLRPENGRQP